ncbi:hypothetical protein STAS_31875 [Striga asiatica]|uniref:Uncharacterized protein n=1 Tax=Striga asiatica TaxID=4170 RepID=A0A5A7RCI8_STRAF|nr:hypothetical protein STAS_31875 [Striga asiatica]
MFSYIVTRLLWDHRQVAPQGSEIVLPNVLPVDRHPSGRRLVESLYEGDNRAFSATARAHEGEGFTRAGSEGEVSEDGEIGPGRVREVNVPELDLAPDAVGGGARGRVVGLDLGFAVEEGEDGTHGSAALDEVGGEGESLGGAVGRDHEDHEDADGSGEVGEAVADEPRGVPEAEGIGSVEGELGQPVTAARDLAHPERAAKWGPKARGEEGRDLGLRVEGGNRAEVGDGLAGKLGRLRVGGLEVAGESIHEHFLFSCTPMSTSASRHCSTNPAVQATIISAEFCMITDILSPIADRTLFASSASLAATLELSFSSESNHAISFLITASNIFSRTRLVRFSPTVSQK